MPLYTLDGKLLVRDGKLVKAAACCCNCNDFGWSECLTNPPPIFGDMQLSISGLTNSPDYEFGPCTSTCSVANLNGSYTLPFFGESPFNQGTPMWRLDFPCDNESECSECIEVVRRDNCGVPGAIEVIEYVRRIEAEVMCDPNDGKVYLSSVGFEICSCQTPTSEGTSCSDIWFPHNLTCMGGIAGCCATQIQGARYRDPCEIHGQMIGEAPHKGCNFCSDANPDIGTVTFTASVDAA